MSDSDETPWHCAQLLGTGNMPVVVCLREELTRQLAEVQAKHFEWVTEEGYVNRYTVVRFPSPPPGIDGRSAWAATGWASEHVMVMDLQKGAGQTGVLIRPGGHLDYDLRKRGVAVRPEFRVFLEFLYELVRRDPDGWWDGPTLIRGPQVGEVQG